MATYQIRVIQELQSEILENVFYYESVGGPGTAEDLKNTFSNDVWDLVRAFQGDGIYTIQWNIYQLGAPMNFFQGGDNVNGALSNSSYGQNLASNVALGVRSPSGGPGTRYSYKRFAGMKAGMVEGDGSGKLKETYMDIVNPGLIAMGVLLEGEDAGYRPVQVQKITSINTAPYINRNLLGIWQLNAYFVNQRTRQQYIWRNG